MRVGWTMIESITSGNPVVLGALVAVGLLLVAWAIAILVEGDVDEGTERVFSVFSGILLGLGSILVIVIGELSQVVAEAPGVVATMVAGSLGWLSLSGVIELAPQAFAFLVAATLIGALATREA
jgi:hypothetical protein